MQFNGIGGDHHNADVHHVTNCIHDHTRLDKKEGAASSASSPGSNAQSLPAEAQLEGQFSLSSWLEKAFGNGKRLLRNIWGSSETAGVGEPGDKSGAAQILAQIREDGSDSIGANVAGQGRQQPDTSQMMHTPQVAAAATAVRHPQMPEGNPYFAASEDIGSRQETIWQKVKVRFENVAGQLAGHLPGKFFGFQARNSFQPKQEKPKEDLRKHSKFRKDEALIDCVLTDDSYLLDSYDRKGEYRKLSTNK